MPPQSLHVRYRGTNGPTSDQPRGPSLDPKRTSTPSTAWRVCSLNSNLTGCLVFFWRTVARSAVYPPAATSSTLSATTSQPRSLLSIARLNMARSRTRPSIWSFVRIDQTCFGRSGGFAPVSLPLFQGVRVGGVGLSLSLSCMDILLCYEDDEHASRSRHRGKSSQR